MKEYNSVQEISIQYCVVIAKLKLLGHFLDLVGDPASLESYSVHAHCIAADEFQSDKQENSKHKKTVIPAMKSSTHM